MIGLQEMVEIKVGSVLNHMTTLSDKTKKEWDRLIAHVFAKFGMRIVPHATDQLVGLGVWVL